MKILKYIFLFIVLTVIALTVFIATQNSKYTLSNSKEINLPKHTVFNYLNDLKNVEQWQVFNANTKDFVFDSKTKGNEALISWKDYQISIQQAYPKDSLIQILKHDDIVTELKWKFESTEKGTLLTLDVKGEMDFITKFQAFFKGGISGILNPLYEKTLNSINHNILEQYNKFSIKNEGIVLIDEVFFIKQEINSKIDDLGEQIFKSMETMQSFCNQNDLKVIGEPFTIFENINFNSGKVNYLVCLPIATEIYTTEGSDISGGKMESFYAYKTILSGDYSHSDKAWKENVKAISENKLTVNSKIKPISRFKKSILNSNKPSEWITEILTPVNESVIYIPETVTDSISLTDAK